MIRNKAWQGYLIKLNFSLRIFFCVVITSSAVGGTGVSALFCHGAGTGFIIITA